jgi:hypothetical protein
VLLLRGDGAMPGANATFVPTPLHGPPPATASAMPDANATFGPLLLCGSLPAPVVRFARTAGSGAVVDAREGALSAA